jgi:predicted amidohydrolase YtcJ
MPPLRHLALPLAAAGVLLACAPQVHLATVEPPPPAPPAERVADLVLRNGTVVTMDDDRPEAAAIAVRDGRILAVGSNAEVAGHVGEMTRVIDLAGRLAIPGFIEGHGHFMGLGQARMILDLTTPTTWEAIVEMVAEAAAEAEPGEWIRGRGWHQERWDPAPSPTVDGVPLHHELSRVSPENPVLLTHASGHAAFANALAMEMAGIDRDTPDPEGGEIIRDAQGEATGLLRETAQRLVGRVFAAHEAERSPEEREAEARRAVELAGEEVLSKGITSFHDAGSPFSTIDFLRELADEGALPVRLYVMVRGETNEAMDELLPQYRMEGYGNDFLTVRSIKRQIDGALGAHGAWLLEPYTDLPTSTGLALESPALIRGTAEVALRHDFQLNTHAIGDRANREVLDIYEEAFGRAGVSGADQRWRIEHAQHVNRADIPRFADLGIIASVQGVHATSDGPWIPQRLGHPRTEETSYLWRDFFEAGILINNGTDAPVEDVSAIESFYASVTRHMANCERFFPEQAMTRLEALRTYTINNAYAAFEEDIKGSLTPGKLADITVLSRNILTVPDEEILDAQADYTIVGGEVRYHRRGAR